MAYHPSLREMLALVAVVDPDAYGTGTQGGDVIDMSKHARILATLAAGTLGSGATLKMGVYGCTSTGTAPVLITGKETTTLTEAGTDSDKQARIEVTAEEVKAQGYRYVKIICTLTAATSDYGAWVDADHSRYHPASELDLASVDEIVA
jgi:hypothetical protein